MQVVYDEIKNERNIRERGLSFDRVYDFDHDDATFILVPRNGEDRVLAVGYLDGRLHILIFVDVPEGIRAISFRKANRKEAERYGRELRRIPS